MESTPALECRSLTKRFGRDLLAVDELSLTVAHGEIYGFVGPNGAGKTTVMRMLLGLIRPSSGLAFVDGRPAGTSVANARCGAIIEEPRFYPHLSGRDNLKVMALHADAATTAIDSVLEQVGLSSRSRRKFGTYSTGMRQRLGLAVSLLADPDILILDEPANGLDPEGIAEMRELLRALRSSGRTIMLSSHHTAEIEQICDRIGIIKSGKLVMEGTIDELRGQPTLQVRAEPMEKARELLDSLPCVSKVDTDGTFMYLSAAPDSASEINRVLVSHHVNVHHLAPQIQSVENTLLDLLSEKGSQS
jgi:ABC-type multidrug transport system ATPase subunit